MSLIEVYLFENSSLLSWSKNKDIISCNFKNSTINTKKIIFATNGFLKSLGIKSNYNFPITLTASMTRVLTEEEFRSIGQPKEWGVLPVKPMGATIRMTKDRRILIRNTAEVHNPFKMSKTDLDKRSINQKIGIKKRFPQLPDDIIQSSWSGIVSRTRNSSQIFEKIDNNVFVAGCYNGSGIGVGTLFGEQIAIKASNENTKEIEVIEARNKPTWLLPEGGELITESYVNLIPTSQGGTHVNGLRTGLLDALRDFCELRSLLPRGIKLAPEDIWDR